jgi:hypothetical protein
MKLDNRVKMPALILKRASARRISGERNDDEFDVLADGAVVGRIMKAAAVPVGQSWMWTLGPVLLHSRRQPPPPQFPPSPASRE